MEINPIHALNEESICVLGEQGKITFRLSYVSHFSLCLDAMDMPPEFLVVISIMNTFGFPDFTLIK